MAEDRRVVVTGVGLVSALGIGTEETWAGLLAGRSGTGPITLFDAGQHTTRFAAEVKGFNPLRWVDKKDVKKRISLGEVGIQGTIITSIPHPVRVRIILTGIGHEQTIITGIPLAIAVGIGIGIAQDISPILVGTGPGSVFPGERYRCTGNICQDITVLFLMECKLGNPGTVITTIGTIPVIKGRTPCSRNNVVGVIIGIPVTVIKPGMIVEMVMACKVDSSAPFCYALREKVSLIRIIIKAVQMIY